MSKNVKKYLDMPGGKNIPVVGLGTFTIWNVTGGPGTVREAVKIALETGYRHIDCAYLYQNEEEVGEAIRAKIADGTITRDDVFVTTKLFNTFHNPKDVRRALQMSLDNLGLDYLDLFLIHWPTDWKDGDNIFPRDENGKIIHSYHKNVDIWKAMEELVDLGLAKNIGLSNFNKRQIEEIMQNCRIKPSNLQVEIHPYFCNTKLVNFCHEIGLTVTAFAPFGNPTRTWKTDKDPPTELEDPVLKSIAASKGKSVAQVILRFLLQRGIIVIPKSVSPERIKENFQVFDFELTNDEMQRIFGIDKNHRYFPEPDGMGHPDYPFSDEF